jgi:hypothetical protein
MLQKLGKTTVLISSLVLMSIMFVVVMFFVNPSIDGGTGSGVLDLQLSFKKNAGIEIINSWGTSGVDHFNLWIFTDYIYAFSYSLFFASLISFLALKKGKGTFLTSIFFVSLAFFSGVLDFIENTMELSFINNPYVFSNTLFFLHSVVALFKWTAVTIVVAYIVVLFTKKNEAHVQSH